MKPSILEESGADILIAGMGEKPILQVAKAYEDGTADSLPRILMGPPLTTEELDWVYELPFTRLPHPRYKGKRIAAYDMIKFSITTHRGCFGGCNFCAITAHQGKQIQSRSEASILREVEALTHHPEFKGTISDLGAPSANMYRMGGRDKSLCAKCRRPSCLFPNLCRNLDHDHTPLLQLYEKVLKVPGVKHVFVSSGIRYDLFLDENGFLDATGKRYFEETYRGPCAAGHGQTLVQTLRTPRERVLPADPAERAQLRDHPVFHLGPSGLHDAGYGGPLEASRAAGCPDGTGAGFHAHADDRFDRNVPYRERPAHRQKDLRGARHRKKAATEVFFLQKTLIFFVRSKKRPILAQPNFNGLWQDKISLRNVL